MVTFVVLAYAFSWVLVPFGGLLGCGPLLAALLVLGLTEGRSGVHALLRRMVQWRVGWGWYAAAVGIPAGAAVLAAVLAVWWGASRPSAGEVGLWTEVPLTFALVLLIPLFGPWEEPGFRGYPLSRLSETRPMLAAALLVGVIHVGFHLPLFLTGDIPVSDAVLLLPVSVVAAWIVVGSRGSVLLAMVLHATNNAVAGEYLSPMFSGADATLFGWLVAGVWCLLGAVLVLLAGRSLTSRPISRDRPPPAPRLPAA